MWLTEYGDALQLALPYVTSFWRCLCLFRNWSLLTMFPRFLYARHHDWAGFFWHLSKFWFWVILGGFYPEQRLKTVPNGGCATHACLFRKPYYETPSWKPLTRNRFLRNSASTVPRMGNLIILHSLKYFSIVVEKKSHYQKIFFTDVTALQMHQILLLSYKNWTFGVACTT